MQKHQSTTKFAETDNKVFPKIAQSNYQPEI